MYFNIICIILLIIILVGIWYILYIRSKNYQKSKETYDLKPKIIMEQYKFNINFVSKSYIEQIIDDSNYFDRMNNINLLVRNVNSIPAYIKLYKDSVKDFSENEKIILTELCNSVDKYIRKSKKILNIEWKFAKVSSDIENGWPHTLGDVIILSPDFFIIKSPTQQLTTLLHEKIHVYQRLFPIETNKLFEKWNFKPALKFDNVQMARNNPDINDLVYAKDDKIFVQLYNSKTPNDIGDSQPYIYNEDDKDHPINISQKDLDISKMASQYEHPNEIMATVIPKIIINDFDEKTDFFDAVKEWISKYL